MQIPFALPLNLEDQPLKRPYAVAEEAEPVIFEFTQDSALMHQYFMLREQLFISTWGLKKFYGGADDYDDISDTLIVRQGNQCVGGARLTFSHPEKRIIMPLNKAGLSLHEALPELVLENKIYAECTRMALLPEFRTKEISVKFAMNSFSNASNGRRHTHSG